MSDGSAYPSIGDYGLIGDCHTAALVSRTGAIDWCCLPRFDSSSTFGRIIDREEGGTCELAPTAGDARASRSYLEDSLVLATDWRAGGAEVRVIDCLAVTGDGRDHDARRLLRVVEGVRGETELALRLAPRFDFGELRPWLRKEGSHCWSAIGGDDGLVIACDVELAPDREGHELVATFAVRAGQRVRLSVTFRRPEAIEVEEPSADLPEDVDAELEQTLAWWNSWHEGLRFAGPEAPGALRSALVLKALTYAPTGAIVAAPTTSLPEAIGANRNWDYRFSWIRDSSFASRTLAEVGADGARVRALAQGRRRGRSGARGGRRRAARGARARLSATVPARMKAMVLAAGLGTRLRPLTYEIPKPMVPVLDRPVMAHIVDLLDRHGIGDVIANVHYFPDTIRDYFGDRLTYRFEEELLGTAGGVRNCADFFGSERFVIISGDALTDIDLHRLVARHEQAGGIATLTVKRVADTREYGVVLHDSDGRISGFQEKPDPTEALSDLGNCGIYVFEPEIFDYFPAGPSVDWAQHVFPALLENDVPFFIHEIDEYWNDVGSLDELKTGTFDALTGALRLELGGERVEEGFVVGEGSSLEGVAMVEPPVWIGRNVQIGADVRLEGPLVLGDGVRVGDGAALKGSIVLPGTEVAPDAILIGAIAGHTGIAESLPPRSR